jgi:hypothetical protein
VDNFNRQKLEKDNFKEETSSVLEDELLTALIDLKELILNENTEDAVELVSSILKQLEHTGNVN